MSEAQTGSAAGALGAHSKDAATHPSGNAAARSTSSVLQRIQPSSEAIDQILDEAREFVTDRPITAILVAAGIGWLLARVGP